MPSKKRIDYLKSPKIGHPWRKASPETAAPRRINSREKGAFAEREFAKLLDQELGVRLVRNLEQSRSGGHDLEPVGDDAAAVALRRFAIECKRHATITPAKLAEFWKQAEEQAVKASRMPALAFRADRQAWAVLVPLCALNRAYGAWEGIEWTAALSVPAFCALVRESVGQITTGLSPIADHGGGTAETNGASRLGKRTTQNPTPNPRA